MKYRYSGPLSGVTLADGTEVMLHPGADVDLPEGHDYTKTLLALGHLSPTGRPEATAAPSGGSEPQVSVGAQASPLPQPKTTKAKGDTDGR